MSRAVSLTRMSKGEGGERRKGVLDRFRISSAATAHRKRRIFSEFLKQGESPKKKPSVEPIIGAWASWARDVGG